MPYEATVYRVMIASPSDVKEERKIFREVIHEWNLLHSADKRIVLLPVAWETDASPEMGKRPQAIINRQLLEGSDLLVATFWTRIGTPTGQSVSGTAEEIEKHVSLGKPAMVYFSSAPVSPDRLDAQQYEQLKLFKRRCEESGLIDTYSGPEDFRDKFRRQLARKITEHEYFGASVRAISESVVPAHEGPQTGPHGRDGVHELSAEARQLLVEASQDRQRTVMRFRVRDGLHIQTNGKQLVDAGNARSEANWEAALEELCSLGFLKDESYKREVFSVTRKGFELADTLRGT